MRLICEPAHMCRVGKGIGRANARPVTCPPFASEIVMVGTARRRAFAHPTALITRMISPHRTVPVGRPFRLWSSAPPTPAHPLDSHEQHQSRSVHHPPRDRRYLWRGHLDPLDR